MLEYIYLFVFVLPYSVYGHCYTIGANPGFSDVPSVTQLTPWMVRVSWKEVVTQRECSDHFLVKYWRTDDPQNVMISGEPFPLPENMKISGEYFILF